MTSGPALEARHLSRRFGGVLALDDVSLTASSGEISALVGPNGAGKSTLFHCLAGSLRADSGSVLLDGRDISRLSQTRAHGAVWSPRTSRAASFRA